MTHAASKDDLRVSTLFDFTSHVILVTGGATGLGEMAAQAFIQNGARVFIASRKESELASTTARLNALGPGKCSYIVADLKDKAGCLALCAELQKQTDRLTVLVNNTGASWGDDYYNYPEHAWDKLYALNVKSIFYMTVGCEGLLSKGTDMHNPSRVINVASMAGIATVDVTTGEGGGLSKPGHGTFSCMFSSPSTTQTLKQLFLTTIFDLELTTYTHRRPSKSSMHPPNQDASFETCSKEYHGQRYLPRRLPLAHDEFRPREIRRCVDVGTADGTARQAE
jgi:hypothetical protein